MKGFLNSWWVHLGSLTHFTVLVRSGKVQLFSGARGWHHISKTDQQLHGGWTVSWCFWKGGCCLLEERSPRNSRVVCHPFLSHAYANEMQMCRRKLFTEGPRRVFIWGMRHRELDQSKSALVVQVSQKKVLGGKRYACCCVFMTQQLRTASSLHKLPRFTETTYWIGKK